MCKWEVVFEANPKSNIKSILVSGEQTCDQAARQARRMTGLAVVRVRKIKRERVTK